MDRNPPMCIIKLMPLIVALRKESVDRNENPKPTEQAKEVALRKESVDRNDAMQVVIIVVHAVALRKESVDRNRTPHHKNTRPIPSLSARRAWIEIILSR